MESIQQLIGHLERNPQWQAQAQFRRIVALWPTVVGPAVSQHSRPTGLQQQVLQVAVFECGLGTNPHPRAADHSAKAARSPACR
jgi:predicted nucleic acid-binding Zn ribbon protein